MAKHLYQKDYELLEEFDERGKVHYSTRYIGSYYRFEQESGLILPFIKRLPLLVVAGWGLFVLSLLMDCRAMHQPFAAVAYIFTVLPLTVLTRVAGLLQKCGKTPDRMERRFADPLNNQYPPAALFLGLLPGMTGIWAVLTAVPSVMHGQAPAAADLWFMCCALLLCVLGLRMFRKRQLLRTVKTAADAADIASG